MNSNRAILLVFVLSCCTSSSPTKPVISGPPALEKSTPPPVACPPKNTALGTVENLFCHLRRGEVSAAYSLFDSKKLDDARDWLGSLVGDTLPRFKSSKTAPELSLLPGCNPKKACSVILGAVATGRSARDPIRFSLRLVSGAMRIVRVTWLEPVRSSKAEPSYGIVLLNESPAPERLSAAQGDEASPLIAATHKGKIVTTLEAPSLNCANYNLYRAAPPKKKSTIMGCAELSCINEEPICDEVQNHVNAPVLLCLEREKTGVALVGHAQPEESDACTAQSD